MQSSAARVRALKFNLVSRSRADTQHIGRIIGLCAAPPLVIALSGPVGAGKTTLVKGIARGMGIAEREVCSPSFVIVREYEGSRYWLYHADFYRLERAAGIAALGLEEYVNSAGILVMEWPRSAARIIGQEALQIRITPLKMNERRLTMTGQGTAHIPFLHKLRSRLGKQFDVSP